MNQYLQEAEAIKDNIITNRRYLHENAEVGFDLPVTRDFVKKQLRACGIEPQELGGGITFKLGSGSPVLMLRADMDALPMQEETGLVFSSKTNAAHMCGHDAHTAMLLGAAELLKKHEGELKGTVKFIFQPAEEILSGSKKMIEEGILENPHVDAAMGMHMCFGAAATHVNKPGRMVCASKMTSADGFRITVHGKGCHGSMPAAGISPIVAGCHVVLALQEIPSIYIPLGKSVALSVGLFQAGTAPNIIPETAIIRGSLRALDWETRKEVKKRIISVAENAAAINGATAEVEYLRAVGPLVNDPTLTEEMMGYCSEVALDTQMIDISNGSEDFANYSEFVPVFFVNLCAGSPVEGYQYAMHSPKAAFDENVLPQGTAAFVTCAIRWLENHSAK